MTAYPIEDNIATVLPYENPSVTTGERKSLANGVRHLSTR